jgi:hypothetical protein
LVQLRSALLNARTLLYFGLVNVLAIGAATAALLPLALRGRPLGERLRVLEPPRRLVTAERQAAARESPTGSS